MCFSAQVVDTRAGATSWFRLCAPRFFPEERVFLESPLGAFLVRFRWVWALRSTTTFTAQVNCGTFVQSDSAVLQYWENTMVILSTTMLPIISSVVRSADAQACSSCAG